MNVKWYLMTIGIETAFDSLDHAFPIRDLEKYGFATTFINWIKIFLNEMESCVINGRITTKYFRLEKVKRQGNPVSAYLFMLCLGILFMLIKNNENIEGIKTFENTFFYNAHAVNSTFFLKDKNSIKELLNTINYFSSFTGFKQNLSICEVAGISALKGVKVAICEIKCVDFIKEAIKILRVFFSYAKICSLKITSGKQY